MDFLLPGDFFGFASRERHSFTVEAVSPATVLARYGRRRLERLNGDPRVGHAVRAATSQEMSRLQARILLLGRITALAKVSGFLAEMASRSSRSSADRVVLPVARYDIADYLALSIEIMSRAMTVLKQRGNHADGHSPGAHRRSGRARRDERIRRRAGLPVRSR